MRNAGPEVKRRADAATLSDDDEGFAAAVERLVPRRARGAAAPM
jgi:hypothetical protein